jgi:hypothetical protein
MKYTLVKEDEISQERKNERCREFLEFLTNNNNNQNAQSRKEEIPVYRRRKASRKEGSQTLWLEAEEDQGWLKVVLLFNSSSESHNGQDMPQRNRLG